MSFLLNKLFQSSAASFKGALCGIGCQLVTAVRFRIPTYNPNNYKRKHMHGFLIRCQTAAGKRILNRKRKKGRKHLSY